MSLFLSYPYIAACLYSLAPHDTSLTIPPHSINHQSTPYSRLLIITIQVLKGPGAHGGASAKDNVDVMKTFARPKTGLRGLVAMVDEVVKDLDA